MEFELDFNDLNRAAIIDDLNAAIHDGHITEREAVDLLEFVDLLILAEEQGWSVSWN